MTAPFVGTKTGRYIVAHLRQIFRYWPPKAEIRRKALRKDWTGDKYECAECYKLFERKQTHVDHILPVVGPSGIHSWDAYVSALFCPVENLRVVCKPCHKRKTNAENKERHRIKVRLRKGRPITDKFRARRTLSKS